MGSFVKVIEAWKILKERHKKKVQDCGFGAVEHITIHSCVSRPLAAFLMQNLDTGSMTINFGRDKVIRITKDAIKLLFDFPNGKNPAPRPVEKSDNNFNKKFRRELGLNEKEYITMTKLFNRLRNLVQVEDVASDNLAVKIFFLILFQKVVVAPHDDDRCHKVSPMVDSLDFVTMSQMDFCQLIVDEIKKGAEKWQNFPSADKNIKAIEGLALAPVIMYLDSLLLPSSNMGKQVPRARYMEEKVLKASARKDVKNTDKPINPDDYVFGKITVRLFSFNFCYFHSSCHINC